MGLDQPTGTIWMASRRKIRLTALSFELSEIWLIKTLNN